MIRFAENLNKMITAGLGGALEAPRTVGHRVIYTEASGAVVNFESNVVAPVKNLRVTMEPIQAGSGDPSPDNIRPISGRESVTVWREVAYDPSADPALTVQLGQTVYGGNAEIISGSGESTYGMVDLGTLSWQTNMGGNNTIEVASYDLASVKAKGITNLVCNMLPTLNQSSATDDGRFGIRGFASSGAVAVKIPKTVVSSTQEAIAWIQSNHPMMCYELATPQTLALTPASLSTLKGDNTVWSDAGDVTLEYPYYEETEGY